MAARVHIIIGPSAAELSSRLVAHAQSVTSPIWLVPTERHGEPYERAFTFPQLALKLAGPASDRPLLSEPQQRLLMRHVLEELTATRKLKTLGKLLDTPSGIGLVFSLIAELKNLGVGPERFVEFAAEAAGQPVIDRDVALVYQTYQDLLTQHGYLDRAAVFGLAMERKKWPDLGDAVCIDGFAGFSPPELALLQRLAAHVGTMWLTLPGESGESERYAATKSAEVMNAFPDAAIATLVAANTSPLMLHLFVDNAPVCDGADELTIIEAPGIVGEVRMVARAIKARLRGNESIVVAIRNLSAYADLVDETFTEYGIPFELSANLPLSRVPVIAGLFKAATVANDGFLFADVSGLLRNTLFRPEWPELKTDPELPLAADMLLRQLNETRGRDAILNAASRWAAAMPTPLEDEEAEQTQQALTHELAKRCLPFLQRVFALWDDAPKSGPFDVHAHWFESFAKRIGWPDDEPALQQLHADLAGWGERERQIAPTQSWSHDRFLRRLGELAALANRPRSTATPGQVRVLSAEAVVGLTHDHLFILGLGERGFPDLSGGPSLYDQQARASFRGVGLDLEVAAERLPAEKLLFLRLVSGYRKTLTLSYPATDEKGQELLPSSFLRAIRDDLFAANLDGSSIINIERRSMLTDGLDTDAPMSPAEQRIRYARKGDDGSLTNPELAAHLVAVRRMSDQRYGRGDFGSYDGMLADVTVKQEIARRFGPDRALSPTSLEAYIACPFKFFAGRVLKLTKWGDPSEEIEAHRRGSAYHRALTRLHRGGRPLPDPGRQLADELALAVTEYADRAGSRTTKILWQLELERLQRSAINYTTHAEQHRETWKSLGVPRTEFLEEPYEVIIEHANKRVKLGGRIDRIDIVETDAGVVGFLVIDYKTGKSANYTGTSVKRLESLQLAVYALAGEHRLGNATPLGLLYWLPLDGGPKIVSAKKSFAWPELRQRLERWLIELAEHIRHGEYPLKPRSDKSCDFCEFHQMCRIAQGERDKTWSLPLPLVEGDVDE